MTETEWRACVDPYTMLDALTGRISDRKLRLFAAACCRRVSHLLKPPADLSILLVVERFVEGEVSTAELQAAHQEAYRVRPLFADASWALGWAAAPVALDAAYEASAQVTRAVANFASTAARGTAMAAVVTGARADDRSDAWSHYEAAADAARAAEFREQAALLRELFGDPFRPTPLDPAWCAHGGGTVRRLAEAVDSERAYDRLPILGDALEDAGCTHPVILDHCCGQHEHVRGCWLIDLLLGKS